MPPGREVEAATAERVEQVGGGHVEAALFKLDRDAGRSGDLRVDCPSSTHSEGQL